MPPRRAVGSAHSVRYREFLRLLKGARRRATLTQIQVARALGRPQSFVAKCESGERRIDIIELEEFARLYRCSVGSFLPRARDPLLRASRRGSPRGTDGRSRRRRPRDA